MAERETTAGQLQRILGMSQADADAMALKLDGAAEDIASFKGTFDGLTKSEQIEKIGEMMAADRICFANLQQVSRDVLTRMAARTE